MISRGVLAAPYPTFPHATTVVLPDRVLNYNDLIFVGALVMVFIRCLLTPAVLPTAEPLGDSTRENVWCILPGYDETPTIHALLQTISQTDLSRPVSVILVDDGGTDETTHRASEEAGLCGEKCRVELIVERQLRIGLSSIPLGPLADRAGAGETTGQCTLRCH